MQKWCAALCALSLGCTAVQMLVDNKGLGRILYILLACCFLCAMLTPLSGVIPESLGFGDVSDSDWMQQADRMTLSALESTVVRESNAVLNSYGYHAEKSHVIADISEDGRISIEYIILYVDADSYKQSSAVRQLVTGHLGCETVVRQYEG